MINKIITTVVVSAILFSGCAVKQEDSTTTKALKNTVNVPAAAVYGAGKVATDVLTFAVLSPFALLGSFSKNSVEKKVQIIKDYKKNKKLESKKIFIKDYSNEFNKIALESFSKQLKEKEFFFGYIYDINKSIVINDKNFNHSKYKEFMFPDNYYFISPDNNIMNRLEQAVISQHNKNHYKFKIDTLVNIDSSGIPVLKVNKKYNSILEAYVDYLYINRTLIEYARDDKLIYNISLVPDMKLLVDENKLELKFLSTVIPKQGLTVEKILKDFGAEIVDNEVDAEIIYHTQFIGISDYESLQYSTTLLDKYFSDIVPKNIRNDHRYNYIALDKPIDFEKELDKVKNKKQNQLDYIKYRKKNKPFKSNIFTLSQGYLDVKDGEKFDKPVFGGDYAFAANLYCNSRKFRNQSTLLFTSELMEVDSKR